MRHSDYLNNYRTVYEAYEKPSETKVAIEKIILDIMNNYNGHSYRVLSRNCFMFTAAFLTDNVNPETGEVESADMHYFSKTKWDEVRKDFIKF